MIPIEPIPSGPAPRRQGAHLTGALVRGLVLVMGCAAALGIATVSHGAAAKPEIPAPAEAAQGSDTDSDATRVMIAEIALERGDCVEATRNYVAVANQSKDKRLAARAAAVAMVCGQIGPAGQAIKHWRELAPRDGEGALAATLLALKMYDLDTARSALTVWRDSGAQASQEPSDFAELLERESDATAAFAVFSDVLAADEPTAEVLLAQAQLGLRAFNVDKSVHAAKAVLAIDGDNPAASSLIVRAQALRGDAAPAVAAARALQPKAQGEDAFIVADVLATLDRVDEARTELQRLSADPQLTAGAQRRLGSLALDRGDIATAERHFAQLVTQQGASSIAVLYLAQIAERKGDTQRALQSYALLLDTPLGSMARARSASILMQTGKREQALAVIDEYAKAHPEEAVEQAGTRADLLAHSGDFPAALADIEASLKRFPAHPTLEYQRATILERAGRGREAEAAFEQILKARPQDPGIANALGYTLADHNRDLPRAQKLIEQALKASPDSPAIQDSQGWLLYRQGKVKDAVKVLELAFRNGHDAEIGAHLGEVQWKTGDKTQAQATWTRALQVDPKNKAVIAAVTRFTGKAPPSAPTLKPLPGTPRAAPEEKPDDVKPDAPGIQRIRFAPAR